MTYLTKQIVRRNLCRLCEYHHPGLANNEAYWRMFEYLMFGTWTDETTGRLLLNKELIATIEGNGKWKQAKSANYVASIFLESFRRDVFNDDPELFDWQEAVNFPDGKNKRARTLTIFNPDPAITQYIEEDMEHDTSALVYFSTRVAANAKNKKKYAEEIKMDSLELIEQAQCQEAKNILEYLNNLNSNRFTKLTFNFDSAFRQAQLYIQEAEEYKKKHPPKRNKSLSFAQQLMTEDSERKYVMRNLNAVISQIQPFYKPSTKEKTVRIFSLSSSILTLPRRVRKAMTEGWWNFDLRSSQLAICAKEWKVPLVMEFLKTRQSIWTVLFKHLGLDHLKKDSYEYDLVKKHLKEALYSLFFGMEIPNIKKKLTEELKVYFSKGITAGQLFFKNDIIQAMAEARQRRMDELILAGVAYTIYGKKIEVWCNPDTGESNINSVLAEQAQAIEMYLLYPVIDLAKNTNEFEVTLWLHDGFSVAFKNESKRERWTQRIQKAVEKRAEELGIITELEVEYNPPMPANKIINLENKVLKLAIKA